jgi:hypothetical protein
MVTLEETISVYRKLKNGTLIVLPGTLIRLNRLMPEGW